MDELKDYYAINGEEFRKVIIDGKDCELHIDTVNEIQTISTDKSNIVIMSFQVTNDEIEEKLKAIKNAKINLQIKCKTYSTGEYVNKEKLFRNMRFVKQEVGYNCYNPSNILFIFADKKYSKVKNIVDEYLSRKC